MTTEMQMMQYMNWIIKSCLDVKSFLIMQNPTEWVEEAATEDVEIMAMHLVVDTAGKIWWDHLSSDLTTGIILEHREILSFLFRY